MFHRLYTVPGKEIFEWKDCGSTAPAYDVIIACAAGEVRERGGRDSWQQLPVMGGNARLVIPRVLGTVNMLGNAHVWQCSWVAMLVSSYLVSWAQ